MTTCSAVNCGLPNYPGVVDCDRPAVAAYELRPGVVLPICREALRQLQDFRPEKVRELK